MSLDVSKLQNVRCVGGNITARCPACAERGGDKNDENHLIIYPDGAFGCVAHQKDKEHRKRIWALARQEEVGGIVRPLLKPFVEAPRQVVAVNTNFAGTGGTGYCRSGGREESSGSTEKILEQSAVKASQPSQARSDAALVESDRLIQEALRIFKGEEDDQ